MPAINTVTRPIRPGAPPSPLNAEGFALLGLQAAIMAERRAPSTFKVVELHALADACRAKASSLRGRQSAA